MICCGLMERRRPRALLSWRTDIVGCGSLRLEVYLLNKHNADDFSEADERLAATLATQVAIGTKTLCSTAMRNDTPASCSWRLQSASRPKKDAHNS